MRTRIVWSNEEKAAHYERMVLLFKSKPHLDSKNAFREAQDVLPYERHRKVTDGTIFTHKALLLKARDEAKRNPIPAPEPVSAPAPAAEPVNPLLKIFDDLLDLLADRIAERLRPQMTFTEVKEQVNAQFDTQFKRYKVEVKPPNPRKPTVLIVGLNGCQMSVMTSKYHDVKFTFMTGEEAVSRHRFNADHTILMTKFINHSAQAKYRTAPNLHYCNGGVSDLTTLMHIIMKGLV
jgi:hypothetical protein